MTAPDAALTPSAARGATARTPTLPVRARIAALESSPIRAIAHLGMDDPEVIPLWFGEPDLPTPGFIVEAAAKALRDGHTFYSPNRGVLGLREALAEYQSTLYRRPIDIDRITVSVAGMNALMLVAEALIDPGDNLVVLCPVWPNFTRCIEIMGGEARMVALEDAGQVWRLDLERLFAACDRRTRAICVNSPSNPTGWMMSVDEQRLLLEGCRRRGLWLISDEVYARLVYDRPHAPSFLEIAEPDDLLIVVNSFSKSWAMTGWRLGWMTTPPALGPILEKLTEYNVASPPTANQIAGITALRDGEPLVRALVERYRLARDTVFQRLDAMRRVRMAKPEAAFYAYFSVQDMTDSMAFAKRVLAEAKVGLAPGLAFGPGGDRYLRICFAKSPELLGAALDRLAPLLD